MDFLETLKDILMFALPGGFLGSIVTWLSSRRQRNNDFLAKLQKSIDLLTEKYTVTLDENVRLQADNARLLANQRIMEEKIDAMSRKIDQLTKQLKSIQNEKPNQGNSHHIVPRRATGGVLGEQENAQQQNGDSGRHGIVRLRGRRGRRPANELSDTVSLENARADALRAGGADTGPDGFGEADGGEPP